MAADAVGQLGIHVVAHTGKFSMRRPTQQLHRFSIATKQAESAVRGLLIGVGGLTTMGGISTMLGVGGISYAMVRFAGSVEQLNQSFHSSLAIMGDLSTSMRSKMMDTVMDVAAKTRYSASDIAKSYYYLASAGLDAQQSIAAMPYVAKFAQAGMFDMARATDLVTDAQSALGLTVKDATKNLDNMRHVGDALVMANTLANASVEQFSISLTTKAGAALRLVNKEIEEGLAALAVFADQGVKGEQAGTALAIVMRDLQTKAVKFPEAFNRMGVAVYDTMGKMRSLVDIIRDLENAMGGMSDFSKKKLILDLGFSDKSVNFLLQLIGKSKQMAEYEQKLYDAKGKTDEVAAKQMTEWMKTWNKISGDLMRFGEKHVLPLVNALAGGAGKSPVSDAAETTWWLGERATKAFGSMGDFGAAFISAISAGAHHPMFYPESMGDEMRAKHGAYMQSWKDLSNRSADRFRSIYDLDALPDYSHFPKVPESPSRFTRHSDYSQTPFGGSMKPLDSNFNWHAHFANMVKKEEKIRLEKLKRYNQSLQAKIDREIAQQKYWHQYGTLEGRLRLQRLYDQSDQAQRAREIRAEELRTAQKSYAKALSRLAAKYDTLTGKNPLDTWAEKGVDVSHMLSLNDKIKKAEKHFSKLADARKVWEDGLSEWERFQLKVHDLDELLTGGYISKTDYNAAKVREQKAITDGLNVSNGSRNGQFAGAIEKGSMEAYKALIRYTHGGTDQDANRIRQQTLEEQKKTSRGVQELVRKQKSYDTETVSIEGL